MMGGEVAEEFRAGVWLHMNPHRIDLGRVGLRLRLVPGAEPESDPGAVTNPTSDSTCGQARSSAASSTPVRRCG